VENGAGHVQMFVPFSSAIALCFPEAFCTRCKRDCSVAQEAAIPLHNCSLQPHLGLRDRPRGDGPGHHSPGRLEVVELLSPGLVRFSRRNHCGDLAEFPSGGPLCGFPFVPCFHIDLPTKPYSMIQTSAGLPVPSQGRCLEAFPVETCPSPKPSLLLPQWWCKLVRGKQLWLSHG